jgi:hypothetical protein
VVTWLCAWRSHPWQLRPYVGLSLENDAGKDSSYGLDAFVTLESAKFWAVRWISLFRNKYDVGATITLLDKVLKPLAIPTSTSSSNIKWSLGGRRRLASGPLARVTLEDWAVQSVAYGRDQAGPYRDTALALYLDGCVHVGPEALDSDAAANGTHHSRRVTSQNKVLWCARREAVHAVEQQKLLVVARECTSS